MSSLMRYSVSVLSRRPRNFSKLGLHYWGEVYPLTHNLELLLGILRERGAAIEEWRPLVEYTPFAGRIRYEAGDPTGQPLNRAVALLRIEALYEQVTRLLPANSS